MIRFESGAALPLQHHISDVIRDVVGIHNTSRPHEIRCETRPLALDARLFAVVHPHQHLSNSTRQIEGIDERRVMRIQIRHRIGKVFRQILPDVDRKCGAAYGLGVAQGMQQFGIAQPDVSRFERDASRAVAGGFGAIAPYVPPIITLEAAKTSKNLEINTARAAANSRTFPHDGHNFACDALSRSDIDGINGYVALNGDFPAQFPGVWKTVANGYYPLPDIEVWKAFYAAMVATGAANFAHAQALKARLAAATTIEEVEAISW